MWIYESAIAWTFVHLVPGETVIAKDQFLFGHGQLGVGFEPAMMLHALGQGVPQEHDMLTFVHV